jgi:hypothetical protein
VLQIKAKDYFLVVSKAFTYICVTLTNISLETKNVIKNLVSNYWLLDFANSGVNIFSFYKTYGKDKLSLFEPMFGLNYY